MSVRGRIASRPDLDHSIFRRSAALPPEHRVDVRQVGQRDVGGEGVRGTREIQLPTILVDLVMLQPAKRLVGGEYHLPTVLPIAVIMLLLVRVRTAVIAAALLEESVRYALLRLVLLQMLSDFTGILQGSAATVQSAVMMLPTRVAHAFRTGGHQISQFGSSELLGLLMLLLIETNGAYVGRNGGG